MSMPPVVGVACIVVAVGFCPRALCAQNTSVRTTDDTERRDQAVTAEDLAILHKADEVLASSSVWNRHDTRICNQDDTTWSLFCALEKGSLFVLGEYRHREVALQEVRFAVEEASKGMRFDHRLMDYNNLPSTTFDDVKGVLAVATERVAARLAAQNAPR
jgi:hypothetical protein